MEDHLERLILEKEKVLSQLQKISDEIGRLTQELNNGLDQRRRSEVMAKLQRLRDEDFLPLQRRLYDLIFATS